MPTSANRTYTNQDVVPAYEPELARLFAVNLPVNVSYPKGTVLGELTASPGTFAAYASANSDGSQNPKAILPWDVSTDAAGNITLSTTTNAGGDHGFTDTTVSVYYRGVFRTIDLPQTGAGAVDANAITKMGRLISGSVADGFWMIG